VPYSRLWAGVAILAESGETFTGGNAENISFGFTIWAAAFAAIIAGYRQFAGIAVVAEFHSSLPSYAARREGAHKVWTLAELFPSSFDRMWER
jgi:cytidine deaminase